MGLFDKKFDLQIEQEDSLVPNSNDHKIKLLQNECEKLDSDYFTSLYMIKSISQKGIITRSNINSIKKLNIIDYKTILSESTRNEFGESIIDNIFIKSFTTSHLFTTILFHEVEIEHWDDILNKYRRKYIEIGCEVEFIVKFINNLHACLKSMYLDYSRLYNENSIIESIFNFQSIWEDVENENDLELKKQKYIDVISYYNMMFTGEELGEYEKLYCSFIEKCYSAIELIDSQLKTGYKTDKQIDPKSIQLKLELKKYGFFNLGLIKKLTPDQQDVLFMKINSETIAYKIAMLEFLGFIKHLDSQIFNTRSKLYIEVGKWFYCSERTIKGHLLAFNPRSNERNSTKNNFNAYTYRDIVEEYYELLKLGG